MPGVARSSETRVLVPIDVTWDIRVKVATRDVEDSTSAPSWASSRPAYAAAGVFSRDSSTLIRRLAGADQASGERRVARHARRVRDVVDAERLADGQRAVGLQLLDVGSAQVEPAVQHVGVVGAARANVGGDGALAADCGPRHGRVRMAFEPEERLGVLDVLKHVAFGQVGIEQQVVDLVDGAGGDAVGLQVGGERVLVVGARPLGQQRVDLVMGGVSGPQPSPRGPAQPLVIHQIDQGRPLRVVGDGQRDPLVLTTTRVGTLGRQAGITISEA